MCWHALKHGFFPRNTVVCTKTLCNYINLGLLPIKNFDLPEKLKQSNKVKQVRENNRRFIPKGKTSRRIRRGHLCLFADRINGLLRKLLGYHTPEERFDAVLDASVLFLDAFGAPTLGDSSL